MRFNTKLFLEHNSKKLGISLSVLAFVLIYPLAFNLNATFQGTKSSRLKGFTSVFTGLKEVEEWVKFLPVFTEKFATTKIY